MCNLPKSMSFNVSEEIKRLNRLDLDSLEYAEVVNKFKSLIFKIPIPIKNLDSTELFFRSRICNYKEIDSINELCAPPAHLVVGFQRCNPPGKSMFYSSSKRITTLLECNVQVGDIVYLSQWMNKESTPTNMILSDNIKLKSNKKLNLEQQLIISYIDTLFTRPIHESFSNAYKLTSAITEIITSNFSSSKIHDVRNDGNIALIYPSILDKQGSYNTVFPHELAKDRLKALHVMKLQITKRNGRSIKVKILDNAREIINGRIIWLNDVNKVPLLKNTQKKGLLMQFTGKVWSIPISDSELTENYIEKLLME